MSVPAPAPVDGVAALHRVLANRALEPAPTPEDRERAITALLELAGARRERASGADAADVDDDPDPRRVTDGRDRAPGS